MYKTSGNTALGTWPDALHGLWSFPWSDASAQLPGQTSKALVLDRLVRHLGTWCWTDELDTWGLGVGQTS